MSANRDAPLVKVRDLRKSFGQNEVLRGVDLDVARGEVVSVIGASGSGKTTMLRCVTLLETYDSGSITVDGVEVGYSGEGPARGVARRSLRVTRTSAWYSSSSICSAPDRAGERDAGPGKVRRLSRARRHTPSLARSVGQREPPYEFRASAAARRHWAWSP